MIKGRYIYIEEMNIRLRSLYRYFSLSELNFIFGGECSKIDLDNIENDKWSNHFVFRFNRSNDFAGYIRVINVKNIVEIHGGGINNSFIEKLALSEAWLLMIENCFQVYNVNTIFTSCIIENKKGFKFITNSGFKEIKRDLQNNRIDFSLSNNEFNNNYKIKFIKRSLP